MGSRGWVFKGWVFTRTHIYSEVVNLAESGAFPPFGGVIIAIIAIIRPTLFLVFSAVKRLSASDF